ncbi:hypothetical protein SLE2022_298760 [Rubroshorea leprosula]
MRAITRNLKHRYGGVFASGVYISVAGLVAVAGFVLSMIRDGKLGSKRKKTSEKLCLVPGLENLGNNCFLNVILQALASCSYFQSFLQKIMEEYETLLVEEQGESLPLAFALAALLEELGVVADRRVVLSPHKVMLALTLYIQNFNLTSQQDADEAFFHLWSSLRGEFSDAYPSNQSTLADVLASSTCRILTYWREGQSEQERWQQHLLGPFDGIISSILICQTCSSQISLEYQFFHSLPLSPVLNSCSTIMAGCTLEDCLKQFVIAEKIENYFCSHCWHIAAIKYFSLIGVNEVEIERLKRCGEEDSCDCRNLPTLATLPWSNNFSNTRKQLSIARCPKILCIHLKRVSMSMFGEPIKLQGHIIFPLILDLSPFMASLVNVNKLEGAQRGQVKLQDQNTGPHLNHLNVQYNMMINVHGSMRENTSKISAADEIRCTSSIESSTGKSNMAQTGCSSETKNIDMQQQNDKVSLAHRLAPSETQLYRLVSVVEHFGRAGSGHYTVYRSAKVNTDMEDSNANFEPDSLRWFCISDSEVYSVSDNDVLAADASLLFYERI